MNEAEDGIAPIAGSDESARQVEDGDETGDAAAVVAAGNAVVEAPSRKTRASKFFREWVLVVFVAIAAAVLLKLFVVQQFYVSGESMDYTLHNLDRVLVNKLSYDLHDPNH